MITLDMLSTYEKYSGDIDAFARMGGRNEHKILNDEHWHLIKELLSDLRLVRAGLCSPEYEQTIKIRVDASLSNHEAMLRFYEMSTKANDR